MILEWSTEKRVVNDLLPLEINPRKITEAKRMKMIESIQKFNLVDIPVIDTDGTIISGHQRMRALQAIGRGDELIDVRIPNRKLTTKELKEYNILANQHFGEFDMEVMDIEFKDLDFEDIGVDMKAIEFEQSDMFEKSKVKFEIEKERKAQVIESKEDDFDTTPPAQPFTVLGDLYEIGEHRLLCGDSTDSDQVAKLMNGEKADICISDPPYGISVVEKNTRMKQLGWQQYENDNDINTAVDAFNLAISICDKLVFWGANHYANKLPNVGGWLIWDKQDGKDSTTYSMGELAWTNILNNVQIFKHIWDGFREDSEKGESRLHPSQKPVLLHTWVLNKINAYLILDMFLGSGSTMVASHQLHRKCYGMELDTKYCDVIVKRMHKLDPSLRIIRNGIDITDTIDSL